MYCHLKAAPVEEEITPAPAVMEEKKTVEVPVAAAPEIAEESPVIEEPATVVALKPEEESTEIAAV